MLTYARGVREHFLGPLSRPQIAAMGENCRRISAALKGGVVGQDRPGLTVCAVWFGQLSAGLINHLGGRRAAPLRLSAVAWQSGLMHSP